MSGLGLGWFNGWLFLVFQFLPALILKVNAPRDVFKRHTHWSGYNRSQKILLVVSKIIKAFYLVLVTLTPLKIGTMMFIIGVILALFGLAGLTIAMFNFKNTPFDQPVTTGIYKISRHPMSLTLTISEVGTCIAIDSWIALFVILLAKIPYHFINLAQEEFCIRKYGDSYREYMKHVPRYFLFF